MSTFSRVEPEGLVECERWLSDSAVRLAVAVFMRMSRQAGEMYEIDLLKLLSAGDCFPPALGALGRAQRLRRMLEAEPRVDGMVLRLTTEPRRSLYQKTKRVVCESYVDYIAQHGETAVPAQAPNHAAFSQRLSAASAARQVTTSGLAELLPLLRALVTHGDTAADPALAEMVRKHEKWFDRPEGPGWQENSPLEKRIFAEMLQSTMTTRRMIRELEELLRDQHGIKLVRPVEIYDEE